MNASLLAKEVIQAQLLTPLSCHRFLLNYRLNCRGVQTQVNMIVKNHIVASTVDEQLAHETSNICCLYCPYFDCFMYRCPSDRGQVVVIAFSPWGSRHWLQFKGWYEKQLQYCLLAVLLTWREFSVHSWKWEGTWINCSFPPDSSETSIFPIQPAIADLTPYFLAQ